MIGAEFRVEVLAGKPEALGCERAAECRCVAEGIEIGIPCDVLAPVRDGLRRSLAVGVGVVHIA